jgi:hypothetical protein
MAGVVLPRQELARMAATVEGLLDSSGDASVIGCQLPEPYEDRSQRL